MKADHEMSESTGRSKEKKGYVSVSRRPILKVMGATGAASFFSSSATAGTDDQSKKPSKHSSFDIEEATIAEIHQAMRRNQITAVELTQQYLDRIDTYDEDLNAILTINDSALERAQDLDAALNESGPVGPLHGIPLILKDNFDTEDMPTTGGSETLEDSVPNDDGATVQMLREAGSIVIAKANMHEFAYGWESYSSLGGQTYNAYDVDRVPGGSSGGSSAATAANLTTIATGSDTCGSNRVPQSFNNLVGVRGTIGLISGDGLQPMSKTQDIPGPMTRTVTDTAIMLDVMVGYDPADPRTSESVGKTPVEDEPPITTWPSDERSAASKTPSSYTDFLREDGLEGARIGVLREYLETEDDRAQVTEVIETAIGDMENEGATVVDPVEIPYVDIAELDLSVVTFEFEREFNDYLASIDDPDAPNDLTELISQTDNIHPEVLSSLEAAVEVETDDLDENIDYLQRLVNGDHFTDIDQTDATPGLRQATLTAMADENLDALLYPTVSAPPVEIPEDEPPSQPADSVNCDLSAVSGLPAVTVPAGFTAEDELPVGLELLGRPFDEETLIELSYSYEQATNHRRAPERFGPLSE